VDESVSFKDVKNLNRPTLQHKANGFKTPNKFKTTLPRMGVEKFHGEPAVRLCLKVF